MARDRGIDANTVLIGGIVLGGLYFASKIGDFFGDLFGPGGGDPGDGDEGGHVDPATGDTRPATFDEVTAATLADRIEADVWGGGLVAQPWEQDEDFAATLMVPLVTNDVRMLMNAYGERGTITAPMNLTETVSEYLDGDLRASVNADYQTKGITIRF